MSGSDSIRLEQFRQIKKEIRGSEGYLIVGIDVAKDKHYAFFGTPTGKSLLKKLIRISSRSFIKIYRFHSGGF